MVALLVVFGAAGSALIATNTGQGGARTITFNLAVTGSNTMTVVGTSTSPYNLRAHQSDTITINVVSDREGEVHLHVYDVAFDVQPGRGATHTFKADKTCTCEIEWESTGTHLGTLTVSP